SVAMDAGNDRAAGQGVRSSSRAPVRDLQDRGGQEALRARHRSSRTPTPPSHARAGNARAAACDGKRRAPEKIRDRQLDSSAIASGARYTGSTTPFEKGHSAAHVDW